MARFEGFPSHTLDKLASGREAVHAADRLGCESSGETWLALREVRPQGWFLGGQGSQGQ